MKDHIFRYVVRFDSGAAPNPFGGWCTLAICKPGIRRTAEVTDWIIGFRSRQVGRVTYVMQVEQRLSFSEYWNDRRFHCKRPGRCESSDNIYRPDAAGDFVQIPNRVHRPSDAQRDLSGKCVLVGRRFWYFGDQSPQLPSGLVHLVHRGQAHSLPANRKDDDVATLEVWLSQWPAGVHGSPLDRDRLRPTMPNNAHTQSGCDPQRTAKLVRTPASPSRVRCWARAQRTNCVT